jgi:two-component system OmpR family response regulator
VVQRFVAGDVVVDAASRTVQRQGRPVPLVGREYDLVELLARRGGEVVSREHLTRQLWDRDADVTANALDVLVAGVRRKLDAPFAEQILTTLRGRGYRLG